jgi:phage gp29-like protein
MVMRAPSGAYSRDGGRTWLNPAAPLSTSLDAGARNDPLSSWWKHYENHRAHTGIRSELSTPNTPALFDAFGRTIPTTDDLAFQPPGYLLAGSLRAEARLVHREVPIVTTQTGYAPGDVRNAINAMIIGLFDLSSQLADTIMADSRVAATLASRTGGLLGRPVSFHCPPGFEDDDDAKVARRVWERNWDRIFPESVAGEFLRWTIMHAWGAAQNLWDTRGKFWIPEPNVWHPRYSYFHWLYRCYVAITQDGQVPITPGDGHWVLHAPHGAYRGWMRGNLWSIAPWWLSRNYALRDWSRYSERHGMPIIMALTPAAADPGQISAFRAALQNLGQDTIVQLPQGVEPQYSYGMQLLEATDQGWQGFHQLIEQCNTEITLAIMGQNLTTEVKEGSFAAARVHADVRQTLLEADARALERTVREQIAKPFAAMNWGRPEIAPVTKWNLEPVEDHATLAEVFMKVATGMMNMRRGGKDIQDIGNFAEQFGLNMKLADVKEVPPITSGGGGGGR